MKGGALKSIFVFLSIGVLGALWQRLLRFEGAIFAINLSLILSLYNDFKDIVLHVAISLFVLASLYSFNDLVDCKNDLCNERKDQLFTQYLCAHRTPLFVCLLVQKAILCLLIFYFVGLRGLLILCLVYVLNSAYSLWIKGIPVADVIWVCFWAASHKQRLVSTKPRTPNISWYSTGTYRHRRSRRLREIDWNL